MRIVVNKQWRVYLDFGRAGSLSLQLYWTYNRLLHMSVAVNNHDLPIYKKNRIFSLLCIFETTTIHCTMKNNIFVLNSHQFFWPHQNLAKSHHLSSDAKDSKPLNYINTDIREQNICNYYKNKYMPLWWKKWLKLKNPRGFSPTFSNGGNPAGFFQKNKY